MEQVLMEAKGYNGQLELLETKIRIKREGFLTLLSHGIIGDKEILVKQISSIQFKNAGSFGRFIPGYIQFAFLGGQEAKGGLWQAKVDENTVTFGASQQPSFEKIKEAIEKKMTLTEKSETKSSNLDELEKLAGLRDKGIITEEEFNSKKKQLLDI